MIAWFIGCASAQVTGAVGVVVPGEEVVLSADADGVLLRVERTVGTRVVAGERLGAIERPDDRDATLAAVAAAEAARADAELVVAFARRRSEEQVQLAAIGASSAADREEAALEADRAVAAERRAAAALAERRAQLEGLDARREARALTAPFAGTVAQWWVDPGERVSAGAPVVRLAAVDTLWVRFALEVGETGTVGQRIRVVTEPGGPTAVGTVRRVAPELERASQTTFVEADVDPGSGLVAGQDCWVHLE